MSRSRGFTLVELLVVIVVLAILMAIALPLYLRSVRDSQRRTCRANMQVIAHAEQAYRVRSATHVYTADLDQLVGLTQDLQALPRCPADTTPDSLDYTVELRPSGEPTIRCACDDSSTATDHNTSAGDPDHGYTPGTDSE